MKRRIIIGVTTAVLAVSAFTGVASASNGPWLSISEGRQNVARLVAKKMATDPAPGYYNADWNVSHCFRWAKNAVQCRWSTTDYEKNGNDTMLCYGNARAVAKFDGWIYSRVITARCQ